MGGDEEADIVSYTVEQVKHVQDLLDDESLAPFTKLQRIVRYAVDQNIACYIDGLKADLFCVHPDNRSSLLLDWFKMHENGWKIKKAGANEAKLNESVCFEVSIDVKKRKIQIDLNKKLVNEAKGHVAPVTGKERYISVGASHFSQFVKAALAGAKTPIKELQDANGCLQAGVLTKGDEFFESLINRGWKWLVFPASAQTTWPKLPSFLQFAYNAGNSLFTPKSEMECLVDISRGADAQEATTAADYYVIADQVAKAMPECLPYLRCIADFARLYAPSDGDDCSAKRLYEFANAFGESRKLGEEFFQAVVDAQFYGGKSFAKLREACLASNLISTKVIDGISRLLVKSDIAKLTKMSAECDCMETAIQECEAFMKHAVKLRKLSAEQARDVLFRFMIRLVLHAVGKGAKSFDERDFGNVDEIKTQVVTELVAIIGKKNDVTIKNIQEKWKVDKEQKEDNDEEGDDVDEMHIDSPIRILRDHGGFEKGSFVLEKKGDMKAIFVIEEIISAQSVKLRQHTLLKSQKPFEVSVSVATLVERWKVTKSGTKQEALPKEVSDQWAASKALALSRAQVSAFNMLLEAEEGFEPSYKGKIVFCIQPRDLRTKTDVKKGELKFAPLTDVTKISQRGAEDSERMLVHVKKGMDVKVAPPELPQTADTKTWNTNKVVLAPFWWVTPASTPENANMSLVEHKTDEGSFHILTNNGTIAANTLLCVNVNAPKPAVLKDATVIEKKRGRPAAKAPVKPKKVPRR